MAYRSAIEGGAVTGASVINTDSSHPESIHVEDAQLIFRGDYHRAGPDLVITGKDGGHHIIPGYFSSDQHPDLVAPNGARLTADIIDLLAGSPAPGQYAQAQATASPDPIGKVEKIVGDVHVVRNGVSVALNVGDLVYKSDVIETGANSSAGIGFPDGTALDLVANTRMALNEYSFEPGTPSDNSALFTLVQGGFAFVAGEVAHNGTTGGGMKIATPVATMGIRGTAGYALEQVATVTANVGNVSFSFAVVADPGTDHVGSYVLIDQFGNEVAVNQAGLWTNVVWNGANTPPSFQTTPMTPANFAIEQQLVPELTNILNNLPPSDFTHGANPQTPNSSHGSSDNPNVLNGTLGPTNTGPQQFTGQPISTPSGPVTPTVTVTPTNSNSNNNNNALPSQPQENTGPDTWVGGAPGQFNAAPNWSDGVPNGAQPIVIDAPQGFVGPFAVTISDSEAVASLVLGANVILDIVGGGAFTVASGISNFGAVLLDSSGGDPVLKINGTVDLLDGGTIQMQGPAAGNMILGVAGTHATLVNVDNTIIGSGSIGQGDGNLQFTNGGGGIVEAKPLLAGDTGLLVINTGNTDSNSGVFEAGAGGTLQIGDAVDNFGAIIALADGVVTLGAITIINAGPGFLEATGANAQIDLFGTTIIGGTLATSDGGIMQTPSGTSTFVGVTIGDGSVIETNDGTAILLQGATTLAGTVTFEGGGVFVLNGAGAEIVAMSDASAGTIISSPVSATLDNLGTIAGAGAIGVGDGTLILTNSGTINADVSGEFLTVDTGNPFENDGVLAASNGGHLLVDDPLTNGGGTISIQGGGIVELNVTNAVVANFSGTGGTLQLDGTVTGGAAAGVDATATGTAAIAITGAGNVTSIGADGIDATAAGGNIAITPAGSVSGAGSGIDATQNGNGNITINVGSDVTITATAQLGIEAISKGTGDISVSTAAADTINSGGSGILAENQATTILASADSSVSVTAEGTIDSGTALTPAGNRPAGILAGYYVNGLPETSVTGSVTVDNFADITAAAGDGIRAVNYGAGNVTVTDEAGTTIQTTGAAGQYGVEAYSAGTGNISVTTSADDTVKSASAGINAVNQATAIAQAAASSITVTANGTIDSGATLNTDSSRPAGIEAGYEGGTTAAANAAVFGNVTVTNNANITALAGDGIRAFNYGAGNVTVTDDANTTIQTTGVQGQYGIEAFSAGVGNLSVTTSAGDTVDASGTGIIAVDQATTIATGADSSISVTAKGTINSGTNLTESGDPPGGILAGYNADGAFQSGVNGNVTVDNFANITAAGGYGINAFNFGNGNVTVTDEANTTISATGPNGIFGIQAFSWGVGNLAITMSAGDVVNSGSVGVVATSFAASEPSSSSISVTAAGTINSGSNTQDGGFPSAGILAGYNPNNTETADANVHGSVSVSSDATINAPAGFGIWAFNFGTGNVTVTTGVDSSITASGPSATVDGVAVPVGIGAYALGGGSASITNDGNVTVANGPALQVQASNGGTSTGTATITNSGVVLGNGLDGGAVVDIGTDPGGSATLTNKSGGEIAPVSLSALSSASDLAIFAGGVDGGGLVTIDNAGKIVGQISLAGAGAVNNQLGGTWDIGGASSFGDSSSDSIDNAGLIDAVGNASISPVVFVTESTGTDEALAGGALNLSLETGSWNYGLSNADGGTITAHLQLGTGNSGTIEASSGGTNTIDVDGGGNASAIGGNYGTIQALAGGIIDINGETSGFLNSSAAFALSVFGTTMAPNGTALGNGMIEALGGAVNFTGSVTNAVNATVEAVGAGSTVTVADTISDGSIVNNSGTIAALNGASISITVQTLTNNAGGMISSAGVGSTFAITEGNDTNNGTVEAAGGGSLTLSENVDGSVNNALVEAINGGMLTIDHVTAAEVGVIATNAATGVIEALNGGIVTLDDDRSDLNYGLIQAANGGIVNIDLALDAFADGGSGAAGGNFGTFQALAGGTVNVIGGSAIEAGAMAAAVGVGATLAFSNTFADTSIENIGTILAQNGGTVSFDAVTINSQGGLYEANDGTIFVNSASTLTGAPLMLDITAAGLADFANVVNQVVDVTFGVGGQPGSGTFELDQPPSTASNEELPAIKVMVNGFGEGDTIDLTNLAFTFGESVAYNSDNHVLTVTDGETSENFTINGSYTQSDFTLISDSSGGTEVVFGTADVWNGGTGTWNAASGADWSLGSVPIALSTAEITASGITVTLSDTETVGNLALGSPESSGATLEIGIGASLSDLNALDVLGGQIFLDADASMTVLGPIDNQGTITLRSQGDAAAPATLNLAFGADHVVIGTLQDTGDGSIVNAGGIAGGTETLDNGTLSIGSTAGSHLIDYDPDGVGATLVLGPHLTIDQTGMAQIASSQATTAIDDEVVSFATINTSAGGTFFIQPDFFANHGDINANQPGATLDIIPTGAFTNFGTVAVSGGQTAEIENGIFSATQPEAVTNEAGGNISVSGAGSSLSIDSSAFVNSGVVEALNGGNLQIEDAVNNSGTGALTANGGTIVVEGAVTGNGTSTVTNDGLLEFQSSVSADQAVGFTGPGTIKIDAPASFNADISMAHADPAEVLDLGGFNSQAGDTFTTSTSLSAGITTLTVTDLSRGTSESVHLVGDFTGATWNVTADGSGGVDVSDPPPSMSGALLASDSGESASVTITASDVAIDAASLQLVEPKLNPDTTIIEAVTNVDGSMSEFALASDQINLAPGQTVTHSYDNVAVPNAQNTSQTTTGTVSVSVGGPGNDNFVFQPGIGADTIVNFNPQADTIELDHFANLQNVQQLAPLVTSDAHGDALIGLGQGDSIALPGVAASYLHTHLQSLVHLG
jgi:large repetitive protein